MTSMSLKFEELVCQSIIHQLAQRRGLKVEEVFPSFGSIPIHVVQTRDTLYVPELALQVVDGHIVPEEAIHGSWELDFEIRRDFQGRGNAYRQTFEPAYVDQEVSILSNFYSGNFGHWITEELIKVTILERHGFEGLYVLSGLPKFTFEFMRLLGVSSDRIIDRVDTPTIFKSVILTTSIDEGHALRHSGVFESLRRNILAAAHVYDKPPLSSRLWMDRRAGVHDRGRELCDADEVYAILDRYGFDIVDMATLPLCTQVAASHNAEILSGPHGAAFVHALFMKPRSAVIECFSPCFVNPSVLELCRMMNHRYSMLVHQNAYGAYPYGKRLKVNSSHLELALQSLC